MSDHAQGILMYETTLGPEARAKIRDIEWADVVIGIPSYRNSRTIGEVVENLGEGIRTYLPDRRVVLMNADGGSSDNTARQVEEVDVPPNVCKLLIVYQGQSGKGTAIRAIMETAMELKAKVCTIVEARAPGIKPEWVPALVDPVLRGADMVLPRYERSAYAAALTDNLAYPFLRMLFDSRLREPLAPEFSLSGTLAAYLAGRDVWETDVARFGVNVWMAIQALVCPKPRPVPLGRSSEQEPLRVTQANLGYRGDPSGDPGAPLDPRFLHTVGTLFRVLTTHRRIWQANPRGVEPIQEGKSAGDLLLDSEAQIEPLLRALYEGRKRYLPLWRQILSPQTLARVLDALEQTEPYLFDPNMRDRVLGRVLPQELWADVVIEFAIVFNQGEGDPDKVAEALLPLFYGRAASYIHESRGMTVIEREKLVEQISNVFIQRMPSFVEKWNHYEPWLGDISEYWLS
ncbi:MAG: hypothetical protein H5T69_16670 [Chloroflexi bacterium]|nr:hypothetical protein [Chloroflexota bacterium]